MASQRLQVFKCDACGAITLSLDGGAGTLVCCEEPMKLMDEQTADMSKEKHVPVVEKTDKGFKVTVGSTLHPMEEKHYIEWIELQAGGKVYREFLEPGAEPSATFCVDADTVTAREFCNVHGLWKN